MTGKDWDKYFKTLDRERKEEIRQALVTLNSDPMIKKAYGSDFSELTAIFDMPFNQDWQEKGRYLLCVYKVLEVREVKCHKCNRKKIATQGGKPVCLKHAVKTTMTIK